MSTDHQGFGAALLNADLPAPPRISDGHGGPAAKRFNVYRNNVAVSLSEALEASFPVVRTLVGDEFFKAMAGVALRQHPPASPLMAEFGTGFPAFLESFAPAASLSYLADVARIETARTQAYHATDVVGLTGDDISGLDPEVFAAMPLKLVPAVTVIRSPYPVATIWHNNQPDAKQVTPQGPQDVLISRPVFDPFVDVLSAGAADVLARLDGTTSLGAALEAAPTDFDFPATLTLLLTREALRNPDKG